MLFFNLFHQSLVTHLLGKDKMQPRINYNIVKIKIKFLFNNNTKYYYNKNNREALK